MLYDKLQKYAQSGIYPMHMPGHKRNSQILGAEFPYEIDITEIHGFDNLHSPNGVLLETARLAQKLYGSLRAFPLINGSTAGILAGIGACAKRGDTILLARNCHISVYNAASLFGLKTAYILPKSDENSGVLCSVSPEEVRRGLYKNPETAAVVITSPTYDGVISDVYAIAEVVHSFGAKLIVDSAHGAHLGFGAGFPRSAVMSGADIVVMSLHKTLPALTQCALLHICTEHADTDETARLLSVLQTSSPSYILMASVDRCLRLLSESSDELFQKYSQNLKLFDERITKLENLSVLCHGTDFLENHPGFYDFDPGKLVINTSKTALSGTEFSKLLRDKHKIELESAFADNALAMTSICDTADGFTKLADALTHIDGTIIPGSARKKKTAVPPPSAQVLTIEEALKSAGRYIPFKNAVGSVSLEFVYAYPPGIPIMAPGELITHETAGFIQENPEINVQSTRGQMPRSIYVREQP